MKTIPEPDLASYAVKLTPAEMNKIHFGGNHTPLTPAQMRELASGVPATPPPGHFAPTPARRGP